MDNDVNASPSDPALWARAQVLIQAAGPAFARQMARAGSRFAVAGLALAAGQVGPDVPREPIVEALRERPCLWTADDGSQDWQTALATFLVAVRDTLERAGPAALNGGSRAPSVTKLVSGDAAGNAAALEKLARQQTDHAKRLLTLIRTDPENAAISVRLKLSENAARWQNTLIVLAQKASTPAMGQLLRLTGDLIRQGRLDEVFSASDLARVARFATQVWLRGQHQDLEQLRRSAARRLGEILDDPQRRPAAVAVLQSLHPSLPIPDPAPTGEALDAHAALVRQALVPALEAWAQRTQAQRFREASLLTVVAAAIEDGTAWALLTPADWVSIGRSMATFESDAVAPEAVGDAMARLETALLDQVSPESMNVSEPDPASHRPTRSPGW